MNHSIKYSEQYVHIVLPGVAAQHINNWKEKMKTCFSLRDLTWDHFQKQHEL